MRSSYSFSIWLLVGIISIMTSLTVCGYMYYGKQVAVIKKAADGQLTAIADLKVAQIMNWRHERLADARFLRNARFVSEDVHAYLAAPQSPERWRQLEDWAQLLMVHNRYQRFFILDDKLKLRFSIPADDRSVPPYVQRMTVKSLRSDTVVMTDLHRSNDDGRIALYIVVPVDHATDGTNANAPQEGGSADAVLVLQIDPYDFLYKFLQTWPTPSTTAETLLVRRDGDDVLFLNELRHRKNTAMRLRMPLNRSKLPAARVVAGDVGIMEGVDYQGKPVLAALRYVPDSPWYMVAKVGLDEIYQGLYTQAVAVVLILCVLFLLVIVSAAFFLRSREAGHLQHELALELKHKQAEQRFRIYFEHSMIAMAIALPDKHWINVNEQLCALLGYTKEELLQRTWIDVTHPDDLAKDCQQYEKMIAGECDGYSLEKRYLRKDGTTVYALLSVRVIRGENGKPEYFLKQIYDISGRKKAEAERERLLEEMERKNAELERFSYSVSHDLRSPLITIQGFTGMVKQDFDSNNMLQAREDLARISAAAEAMMRLLNDLLELSRIGRVCKSPELTSFAGIVAQTLELLTIQIKQRGVQIEIVSDLPEVVVDRMRMIEVMQNLVGNAIKYMGDQTAPVIRIGVRQDGNRRVFYVQDNGMGIDPTHQKKVFGLFDKLDPRSEGTGIGLAVVKRIIEYHGGTIWVESKGRGEGSTFCFTLGKK